MATNLAHALHESGQDIEAVFSRTMSSAKELATRVEATATDNLDDLPRDADAYIIAVKDDALPSVILQLTQGRSECKFFHTAGSVPMSVFGEVAHHGVIYPMQTFSKERMVDFSRVPLFIEANDNETLDQARRIAESVSQKVYELTSEQRRQLHLAAVFACNFSNHCYALAENILANEGIPFDVMLPLVDETAAKVHTISPLQAQTGPAIRYDETILNRQKEMLADDPLTQQLYDLMSKSIHEHALTVNGKSVGTPLPSRGGAGVGSE